jgi:hypothetical protein
MRIQVAIALRESQEVVEVELREGATVADALVAARVAARVPGFDAAKASLGIWSKACAPDAPLREGDRVEIYRPLEASPREMRRARARLRTSTRSRSGP